MENEKLSYRIMRVKDISFNVNENFLNPQKEPEQIKVSLNAELKTNFEFNVIIIEIFASYHYEGLPQNHLASITVQNVFNISNLSNYNIDKRLKLPPNFVITLISLSISHTRALFTKNIDGTAFNGLILPIIDPAVFSKSVFPTFFDGQGLLQEVEVITAIDKDALQKDE